MQSSASAAIATSILLISSFTAAALAGAAGVPRHPPFVLSEDSGTEQPASGRIAADSFTRSRTAAAVQVNDKKVPATATVTVDCTKGDSINDALQTPAETLTIQIHGICTEDVFIARNNVTLVGTSSAVDGVRGDPSTTLGQAVITVSGDMNNHIQNLSIGNGHPFGVYCRANGRVVMSDCDVFGNVKDGLISANGLMIVSNITIHDNGRFGLSAWAGGDIFCNSGCAVSGSKFGGFAASGARLVMSKSTIQSSQYSLLSNEHGWVSFDTGTLAGSIDVEDHSAIYLTAATQTNDPQGFGFYADASSVVVADSGSVLLGPIPLLQFSTLTLQGGSTITGNLACSSGSNAFCENSSQVSGTTSGCSACVKP